MAADHAPRTRPALIVAGILLLVTAVGSPGLRPPSVAEVLAADPWQTGEIHVHGEAENVRPWPTAAGEQVGLDLDWSFWNSFGALPSAWQAYRNGAASWMPTCENDGLPTLTLDEDVQAESRVDVALHFDTYDFDGMAAIWAPELNCPFPMLHMAIAKVLDQVSMVGGYQLVWRQQADGWTVFDVLSQRGQAIPLEEVTVHLTGRVRNGGCSDDAAVGALSWATEKSYCIDAIDSLHDWVVQGAIDFVFVSDLGGADGFNATEWRADGNPILDQALGLAGASENGRIALFDNGDGGFGDGDLLALRLDAAGPLELDTYLILIEDAARATVGIKLLVAHAGTPIVWPALDEHLPRFGPATVAAGQATLEVLPAYDGTMRSWDAFDVRFLQSNSVTLAPGRLTVGDYIVDVDDDGDGLVSPGDRIIVTASAGKEHQISIQDRGENRIIARLAWMDDAWTD